MMSPPHGRNTPSREQLLERLEELRAKLTPQQYAAASARILDQLKQQRERKPRYAIT